MHTITLNNTHYHRQDAFVTWCRKNVGQGEWNALPDCGNLWGITCMFGNITLSFVEDYDLLRFKSAFNIGHS